MRGTDTGTSEQSCGLLFRATCIQQLVLVNNLFQKVSDCVGLVSLMGGKGERPSFPILAKEKGQVFQSSLSEERISRTSSTADMCSGSVTVFLHPAQACSTVETHLVMLEGVNVFEAT